MSKHVMTQQEERVWDALAKAADRVAKNAANAGLYQVKRNRKGVATRGYTLTPEHQELLTAMDALGRGEISAEEAMSLIGQYDIEKARLKGY